MSDVELTELPPRAQIGYVINNANVTEGELTPDMVVTVLRGKGVKFDSEAEMLEVAEDVFDHRGLLGGGDSE